MNHTIAKIRSREKGSKYRKILTEEAALYKLPNDLAPHVDYSPTHNLDEDSWFGIENFSQTEYCLDILKNSFISAEYKTKLKREDVDKIDFIFTYQDDNTYYFQNVTKSQIKYRRCISLGDDYRFDDNSRDITINTIPDAIYLEDIDIMYFRKLSSITGIFDGIESLYREATQDETALFLESDFINLQGEFSVDNVKQANRKRIAIAVDILSNFDEDQKTAVFGCIREFCPDLATEEEAFNISTEGELKLLLYGIEQRFYTTPDGREKRIANSVIKIN